ncbi:hypothetical protein [Streptomyces sp. NPDC056144]|uniref:hypothetical protein n=1 Tax=unclassified Streptomyces TaxID=2593676 RepID=UPI0035DA57AB
MSVAREGMRFGGWVVGGVVALAVLYVIGAFAFGSAAWVTAPFRGDVDERERTVASGAFRLSTYETFFDLCAAVQNAEGTILALQEERAAASPVRRGQIDQSITALRASRIESVNEYNAKAAQEHRTPFLDKGLPYRLDAGATKTTCAA